MSTTFSALLNSKGIQTVIRAFAILFALLIPTVALGQCPGGVCPIIIGQPVPASPDTPIGTAPTPNHEWGWIDGHGYGWRFKKEYWDSITKGPETIPVKVGGGCGCKCPCCPNCDCCGDECPAKKPVTVTGDEPVHGELFYAVVKGKVEVELTKKLMKEKGLKFRDAKKKAKELVDTLNTKTIDLKAKEIGVVQAIGDGGFLDWLKNGGLEKIMELVKMIVMLLAMFA